MDKILVVGSLHYDLILNAHHRPEQGETVIGSSSSHKFGGKGGNQAVSAAKTGADVSFFGAVGDDEFGQYLLSILTQNKVDTRNVEILSDTASGMSAAIMDNEGDYGAVVISNANTKMNNHKLEKDDIWADVKMLILQNEVPTKTNIKAAKEARNRGITVCINAAPAKELPLELQNMIDVLVVNAVEARDMSTIEVNDIESAAHAAQELNKSFSKVVVTAGGDGVAFIEHGKSCKQIPAEQVELVSTHGAGDCFMGILCSSLLIGDNLEQAVIKANKGAALHVSGKVY